MNNFIASFGKSRNGSSISSSSPSTSPSPSTSNKKDDKSNVAAKDAATAAVVGGMNIVLRLRRSWDVKIAPPSIFDVNERMIERGIRHLSLMPRTRRIMIEIHGPDIIDDNDNDHQNVIRNRSRRDQFHRMDESRYCVNLSAKLKDDDLIMIRILKQRRGRFGIHKHTEDSDTEEETDDKDDNNTDLKEEDEEEEEGNDKTERSISTICTASKRTTSATKNNDKAQWLQDVVSERVSLASHVVNSKNSKYTISRDSDDWIEYRKFGLDEIGNDDKQYRKTWEVTTGLENFRERRKIIFASYEQAQDFKNEIDKLRALSKERAKYRLQAYKKIQLAIKARKDRVLSSSSSSQQTPLLSSGGIINTDRHDYVDQSKSQIRTTSAAVLDKLNTFNPVNIAHSALDLLPFEVVSTNPQGTTGVALSNENQNQNPDNNVVATKSDYSTNIEVDEDINLLVEIVSCSDLPIADKTSTDPYVVVYLGVNEIHRTDILFGELNPVWTVHHGSLFMVSCSAEDFFSFSYGLVFCVKDFDLATKNELVGRAELTQEQLLYMNGERIAIELDVPQEMLDKRANRNNLGKDMYRPKLYLRVRKATGADQKFIMTFNDIKKSKREGVYTDTSFQANADWISLLKRETKRVHGVELYRVKPGPDPTRPVEETKWMSNAQITIESLKPSYSWVDSGNGTIGKIYCEIVKCENLPNVMMNQEVDLGDKNSRTDAFCCAVFEDAIGYTDVIRNTTHPRWMPWSQRAFAFNIGHPSSNLMIGVFKYFVTGYHYPIGRVSVNITNLLPNTEYILAFDLHKCTMLDDNRQAGGKITLRIRLEYHSYKMTSLAAGTKLPSLHTLNVANRFEFMQVYYVCHGDEDPNRFAKETLYAYKDELYSYYDFDYEIPRKALFIVLWRGRFPVKIYGTKFDIPIHSLVAFLMGITLVENLNLLPSYLLFSIAWFLLASYESRLAHPSPWAGCLSLEQMYTRMMYRKPFNESIVEYENNAAVHAYTQEENRRKEEKQKELKQQQETAQQLKELYGQGSTEPEKLSAEQVDKKDGNQVVDTINTVNPLTTSLLPYQQMLGKAASYIRIFRSIIHWDESFYAFLILNTSVAVGIIFLFVPWGWVLRWFFRLMIWIFLGPWMKLVDLYVLPKMFGTDLDKDKMLANFAKEQLDSIGISKETILKKREEVYKHRAMKRYMFGKYSVQVPRFKDYHYRDTPLPESSATPVLGNREIIIHKRYPGQTLTGEMIPTWCDKDKEFSIQKKNK